jgi:cobaltochelatase CobT
VNSGKQAHQVRSTIQKRDARGVIRNGAEWLALWSDPESMKDAAETQRDAAARRRRLELERNLAAAGRSIAKDPELRIGLYSEPGGQIEDCNIPAIRGFVDSLALQRRFHDPDLHHRLAPSAETKRRLYDLCELVRCESCGAVLFPGVRANLVARHTDRLEKSGLLNAHLAVLIPLSEGLNMVLRDALSEAREPSVPSSGLWMWDRWIRERHARTLERLQAARNEQGAFACLVIPFLDALLKDLSADENPGRKTKQSQDAANEGEPLSEDLIRESEQGSVLRPASGVDNSEQRGPAYLTSVNAEKLPYRVFTTAHDTTVHASSLFNERHLLDLRRSLEQRREDLRRDLARLAARFQRRLLARQKRDWAFDLEEGLLDASRLDRVIVNPGFENAYKQERESDFPDTLVAILIDNSGSMRGKPIEISFLAADLISAAFEHCGVASEILGFTTREWNGGRSARDWVSAGRPEDPGRVNDLLHVVYKAANEPARRARKSLAAMLDPDLLKENVDGEALFWASRRLLARPEKRKILIVISDGAPVDQFTLENNSCKEILDRHLREAIRAIERTGVIELAAIGVKHDAGGYYRNSVQIHNLENLGKGLIGMADRLLTSR